VTKYCKLYNLNKLDQQ
jgi:hypothetical protein